MKKLGILLLAGIFALNFSLDAQNANRDQKQGRANTKREMPNPEQRADRLVKELELNDAQKAKLVDYYKKQDEERAKKRAEFQKNQEIMREANKADREKFRAEMEKERAAQNADLEKIIGKEKMELLKKKQAERMQKMKENREKRGDKKSDTKKK